MKRTRVVDLVKGSVLRLQGIESRVLVMDEADGMITLTLNPAHLDKDAVMLATLPWDFEVEQVIDNG